MPSSCRRGSSLWNPRNTVFQYELAELPRGALEGSNRTVAWTVCHVIRLSYEWITETLLRFTATRVTRYYDIIRIREVKFIYERRRAAALPRARNKREVATHERLFRKRSVRIKLCRPRVLLVSSGYCRDRWMIVR